jgi:hypothetical protein
VQVTVELSPRQLAGVTLHLKILGGLLGDEQEILLDGQVRKNSQASGAQRYAPRCGKAAHPVVNAHVALAVAGPDFQTTEGAQIRLDNHLALNYDSVSAGGAFLIKRRDATVAHNHRTIHPCSSGQRTRRRRRAGRHVDMLVGCCCCGGGGGGGSGGGAV